MKLAPLQLIDYWSTYIHVEANPDYEPSNACPVPLESLKVSSQFQARAPLPDPEKQGTEWDLQLTIEQLAPEKGAVAYFFKLVMQGTLRVSPSIPAERLERAVHANGPAMLFGAAREIIRASTSRGPLPPIMIPSTNFLADLPALPTPEKTVAKKAAKKAPAKKAAKKTSKK